MSLEFDHVLLAARDVDAAAERLWKEHGLASVVGGRHPGHGTGNRIVPLGDSYLEILGVVDPAEASGSRLGAWVARNAGNGDRLIALCLRTPDLDGVANRLGLESVTMSRTRPDGAELAWTLVALEEMLTDPGRPFFIRWEMKEDLYPGREGAVHRPAVDGLAFVEIGADSDGLGKWVADDSLDLRPVDGQPGVSGIGIRTDNGILELRN